MKKSRLRLWLVIIFVVVGYCTVVSAKNYVEEKPLVTLTNSISNKLHKSLKVTAKIYYQETEVVELLEGCRVEVVFVKAGDVLEEGSALLQLKKADVQIQYLQMQLQKEALEKAAEANTTQGELAYWQLQNLQEEMTKIELLLAADCVVLTETAGIVLQQGYEVGAYTSQKVMLEIGKPESGYYLEWSVSENDYEEYKGTAEIAGKKVSLSWETPIYEKGIYTYRSDLPEETQYTEGKPVTVELLYTSEDYRAVVPKSCIWYDSDGMAYVYQAKTRTRNFGEEYYVRKIGVSILDQDDTNVAIEASREGIVERTSMKLADMMSVVVMEDES